MEIIEKIKNVAEKPISGRLNLMQFKKQKEKALEHKRVCEDVLAFHSVNPSMPMYAILSVGISAGAFKSCEFDKGYKKFDKEKTETILAMALAYNERMGIKGKPSDVVWRLCLKYYNKKSHNLNDFLADLEKAEVMDGKRGHFNELCKNIGIC